MFMAQTSTILPEFFGSSMMVRLLHDHGLPRNFFLGKPPLTSVIIRTIITFWEANFIRHSAVVVRGLFFTTLAFLLCKRRAQGRRLKKLTSTECWDKNNQESYCLKNSAKLISLPFHKTKRSTDDSITLSIQH